MTAIRAKSHVEIIPTGAALGAEVRVDDLRAIDEAAFKKIEQAWFDHSVLFIRNQQLGDPDLLEFAGRFGELELPARSRIGQPWIPEYPLLTCISNVTREDGSRTGSLGNGEAVWHADLTFLEKPPTGCFLYGIEVPETGGNTGFCSLYKAYDTLPDDLKKKIEGKILIHDHTRNSGGELRPNMPEHLENPEDNPGARHPIICTHPKSGRKQLFLGRRPHGYIIGMDYAESDKLLDELWAQTTQEKFTWHHTWQVGDLIIWDNSCVLHRRDSFDPDARRILHRAQIKGPRPQL
ncbi:MAG: TauD/TfdA dioxygenase family protein, partial [Rhodospirillales bacterium]